MKDASQTRGADAVIAILMRDFRGGGAERSMINLANGLSREGLPVDFVVLDPTGHFEPLLDPDVAVVPLGGPRKGLWSGFATLGLCRYLLRRKPRQLISTLEALTVVAYLASLIVGRSRSLVVRVATTYDREPRPLPRRLLIEWVYRRHRGAFVTNSAGSRASLLAHFGFDSDRVDVIANGVDLQAIEVLSRNQLEPASVESGPPSILFVGRLSPVKRIDLLLRSFALVDPDLEARLVIVGEGPLRESLGHLAAELGIEGRVRWVGFSANPFAFMSQSDVLVLCSDYEGMPSVLIEALACGLSIVATDCRSGPREILEDGRWGTLVPVGDRAALTAAIEASLRSPLPALALQRRASVFSIEAMAQSYRRLLSETLDHS